MRDAVRVLLVDDEELSRRALRVTLGRELPDVEIIGEAADGEGAIELTSTLHPDIAIMDIKMPEMDGIEATRRIREVDDVVRVIFLTAYDDFEYARHAVELHADAYLLKPVQTADLKQAVRRCMRRSRAARTRDKIDHHREVRSVRRWAGEQLVLAIRNGNGDRFAALIDVLYPDFTGGTVVVFSCPSESAACIESIERAFGPDDAVMAMTAGRDFGVLFFPGGVEETIGERVLQRCRSTAGLDCRVRIATITTVEPRVRRLYHAMLADLSSPVPLRRMSIEAIPASAAYLSAFSHPYPARVDAILNERDAEVRRAGLGDLVREAASESDSLGVLQEFFIELILLFRMHVPTADGAGGSIWSRGFLADVMHAESIAELARRVEETLLAFEQVMSGLQVRQYSWRLTRAFDFVAAHLSEDVYLDQVAEAVGVGAQHLSRLFREELDTSFTQFLNERRIERARYLLMTSSLSIAAIAAEVGYRDANYFTKVFRKHCHCTPSEYRSLVAPLRRADER